jgi:hypothetical protein
MDPFEEGRAATERRRDELQSLRDDVRALVRDEVRRAGLSAAELDARVDRRVRSRIEQSARKGGRPRWEPGLWGAVGVMVGLGAGYLAFRGPRAEPPTSEATTVESSPAAVVDTPPAEPTPAPPTPAEVAAEYDRLFETRSAELGRLVDLLDAAVIADPVRQSLELWRAGSDLTPPQTRRLHDALVQFSLNRLEGTSLTLDGLITRGPCGGASCGALLTLWRGRGAELGMPPVSADPTTDQDGLALVERIAVVRALEALDG